MDENGLLHVGVSPNISWGIARGTSGIALSDGNIGDPNQHQTVGKNNPSLLRDDAIRHSMRGTASTHL